MNLYQAASSLVPIRILPLTVIVIDVPHQKLCNRVPLIFTFFRYQWGSLTIDRHGYGKSKTAFGRSVALTETRVEPFEVYLVIYSSKMKIWHISVFLGALNIWIRSKIFISRQNGPQWINWGTVCKDCSIYSVTRAIWANLK